MKIKTSTQERGIAILIAMISIFALGVLAGAFAFNMKVETKLASNSLNETQLQWAGRSGIDFARWVLSMELLVPGPGQRYDSLGEAWAGGSDETNEILSGIPHSDIPLGPGVSIKKWSIVDTERKFNVNMALGNPQVLQKALINVGADVTEVPIIMASIQDWIDTDNNTRMGGAETEYYQALDPPYVAKNGPIDDLSELLLIKGIRDDPELYWGSDATNHSSPIFQNRVVTRSGLEAMPGEQRPGLKDIFTPISNGAINILTASETQLQVLPGVDTNIAQQIVQLRGEIGENGSLPYNSPADLLVNTSLGSQLTQQVAPYCTLRSSTFEITVVVQVGMSTPRTYFALVRRNTPRDIPILNMRWEDGDQSASTAAPPPDLAQP